MKKGCKKIQKDFLKTGQEIQGKPGYKALTSLPGFYSQAPQQIDHGFGCWECVKIVCDIAVRARFCAFYMSNHKLYHNFDKGVETGLSGFVPFLM